ncbi:unnamed protein product, partial [Trichogramma brassicae]
MNPIIIMALLMIAQGGITRTEENRNNTNKFTRTFVQSIATLLKFTYGSHKLITYFNISRFSTGNRYIYQ